MNLSPLSRECFLGLKKTKQPQKWLTATGTRTKTDTTRWIHPKSGITTPVSKDAPQQKKGWSYRQSTVTPGKADTFDKQF